MEPEGSLPYLQESATWIQSIHPHPISWRSILILSSNWCLGLPSGLFPWGFPTKIQYMSYLSPMRATWPTHSILLDFIMHKIFSKEYRSWSSSLCSFPHSLLTLSLLGPNILLNTLFSNTFSLHSSLNVSGQVSNPYKITGKIIILYILIFKFFDSNLKDKRFRTEWEQAFPDLNLLLIS